MKRKTSVLLLLFCLCQVCLPSSWKEGRKTLVPFTEEGCLIRPGQTLSQEISLDSSGPRKRRFLRVIGGIQMPPPHQGRGESKFRNFEYWIDDCLDSLIRRNDRYSLYFKGEDDNFERHAYYRISGKYLTPGELTVTIPVVKRNGLSISENGDFGVEIELFYQKEGRAADDIYDSPDSLLYLPIPAGTGKYRPVSQTFVLPSNVSCALLRIGGTHFSGECWVEAPRLSRKGKKDICPMPFTRFSQRPDRYNYWVGCNLVSRCWPLWKLDFNGKTVFRGNIFDRASHKADFYIPLPDEVKGSGLLELTLEKDAHRASFPYVLRSMEIIEHTARDFEVVSVPRYVSEHSPFGILIETNRPGVRLQVRASGAVSPSFQECSFERPGLHVVELRATEAGKSVSFEFVGEGRREQGEIRQIIKKQPDNIYLSCGDDIYIDREYSIYDYYFKWYVSNRVGNWLQFRPSYQWSGVRVADPTFTRHYTRLLEGLQMPYAWQVEGRTLAGKRINPSLETLAGPMFRGKQAHENDGGYYYWRFGYGGLFSDMAARNRPYGGIFAKCRPIYTDHGTFVHYDPQGVTDMADGTRKFIANLRYSKGESTRHTGTTTLFRYFYRAGYEWLGAEQMYGPEEITISSLRGASLAYSRPVYGSLHAMQWGVRSRNLKEPKHALRFYTSLAVAYMHGSSHLNTEDGLWVDEFMNDRYSTTDHMDVQHRMLDFIETHSRRGTLTSNVAVLQGRNCSWKAHRRGSLWSQRGKEWEFDKANESFDLLNVFYPENKVDLSGPEGLFSSTPYGAVDLLPVEAPQDVLARYKVLIFLGWNTYEREDFQRIRNFVLNGGTVMLTGAHLNSELRPNRPTIFPSDDDVVREMLGEDYRTLAEKTVKSYGKGRIIYYPQQVYPADSTLRADYTAEMEKLAEGAVAGETAKGWVAPAASVEFTAWDCPELRTVFLLNTDWQSTAESHPARFVYGERTFPVDVRRYHIETVHCNRGLAVMPSSNTTDVLSIGEEEEGWTVRIQNTEPDTFRCMNALTGQVEEIRLEAPGIHEVCIKKK